MTESKLTERQRKKWREDRVRLRAMAHLFPSPPKPKLTPEEKREIKNAKQREAREAKALGAVDLTCPMVFGRRARQPAKPARKRPKAPQKRASGPWDSICLPPT
jgi:hypothetical protein